MWQDDANCAKKDTNIFFDVYEENEKVRHAIDNICSDCPVQRRCFAEGVTRKEWGVWGGIYLEDGTISKEMNDHKSQQDWAHTWQSLTMGEENV